MKWLFSTLVALNIVVFAGMIAYKIVDKNSVPQPAITAPMPNNNALAPQVIINTGAPAIAPLPNTNSSKPKPTHAPAKPMANNTSSNKPTNTIRQDNATAHVRYKACSATVSLPEDDYHRIKGLLTRFPHAATRQVVENTNSDHSGQTQARMNVLFMSVNDQEASAIRSIVGRYGQLNRTPCNQ